MVRGLVEHEGVGLPEQDPDDVDAPALPTRERVDVVEQDILAEPDTLREAGDVTLEVVSPDGAEPLFEVRERAMASVVGLAATARRAVCSLLVEDVQAPGRQHMGEPRGLEAEPACGRHLGEKADGALDVHVHPRPAGAEGPGDR